MPRLSRTDFQTAVHGIFEQACASFTRAGTVYEAVYGFDTRCRITTILGLNGADSLPGSPETLVLPQPLRDQAEQVRAILRERHCVAAAHVAEAWMVTTVGASLGEVFERLGPARPSEHESRVEAVTTYGAWPQEFVELSRAAVIRRTGTTAVLETLPEVPSGMTVLHQAWLADNLPQPPRAHTAN